MPRSLIEAYQERFGVTMLQGWGMTETSPVCAFGRPAEGRAFDQEMDWRAKTGRVIAGVEIRVVDDGRHRAARRRAARSASSRCADRGSPASYYGDPSPERFHDGWLRTGDVGTLDRQGFMQISDRTKDVIKSGGEWISSVELENEVMAHPDVFEAAVIGVPDARWDERPLVVVVPSEGAQPRPAEIARVPLRAGGPLVAARALGLRRRAAQDRRGQVRQEGALRTRAADGDLEIDEVDAPGARG